MKGDKHRTLTLSSFHYLERGVVKYRLPPVTSQRAGSQNCEDGASRRCKGQTVIKWKGTFREFKDHCMIPLSFCPSDSTTFSASVALFLFIFSFI